MPVKRFFSEKNARCQLLVSREVPDDMFFCFRIQKALTFYKRFFMRKMLFPTGLLGVLVLLQSCSKESQSDMLVAPSPKIINARIAPNETYLLNLDNMYDVKVYKQATHFKTSQTETDLKSGLPVYKYIPAADFTGEDEVVLSSTKTVMTSSQGGGGCNSDHMGYGSSSSSGGSSMSYSTTYITVKLSISN